MKEKKRKKRERQAEKHAGWEYSLVLMLWIKSNTVKRKKSYFWL